MSMVLGDALGPRGRRRAVVASGLASAVLLGLLVIALRRFSASGQLDPAKWSLLVKPLVIRFLLGGVVNTLRAAGLALIVAVTAGTLLALGRLSGKRPVRLAAGAYVQFFRSLPLLILIIFMYFGVPELGVSLSPYWALVSGLAIYNAAVFGEIFRAGILSLDRGQPEAALAIGLRPWQAMWLVILPQAYRRMIPTIVSQTITLLKDTTLGFTVGYLELLRKSQITGEFGNNLLQAYIAVAVLYLAINIPLSRVARRLEVRQRRRYRAGSINVAGAEDVVALAVGASMGGGT
ncbi:MAG: glutamate transport system permease protein [Actinomycetota bacterium]|jgi:glutamate transport system permease protein|nr:glutamate transport system permease protein [Actinomycetota bacterium]